MIRGDLDAFVRDLKATVDGELDVAGPELLVATDRIGKDVVLLTYVPA